MSTRRIKNKESLYVAGREEELKYFTKLWNLKDESFTFALRKDKCSKSGDLCRQGSEVPVSSVLFSRKKIHTLKASLQSKGETQHRLRKQLLFKRN